ATAIADVQLMGLNVATDGVSFMGGAVTAGALAADTLVINGVAIGASATGAVADKAAAINAASDNTGVAATVNGTSIVLTSTDGSGIRVEGAGATDIGFVAQGGSAYMTSTLDI